MFLCLEKLHHYLIQIYDILSLLIAVTSHAAHVPTFSLEAASLQLDRFQRCANVVQHHGGARVTSQFGCPIAPPPQCCRCWARTVAESIRMPLFGVDARAAKSIIFEGFRVKRSVDEQ